MSGSPVTAQRGVCVFACVCMGVCVNECERETSDKESSSKRMGTNTELHSDPIHRHVIQSNMMIYL